MLSKDTDGRLAQVERHEFHGELVMASLYERNNVAHRRYFFAFPLAFLFR